MQQKRFKQNYSHHTGAKQSEPSIGIRIQIIVTGLNMTRCVETLAEPAVTARICITVHDQTGWDIERMVRTIPCDTVN